MQIIDWVKVHELAQKPLAEFLESTKSMGKVDELPSIQKFSTYMDRYEKQVLPSLLQNMQITPAKFVTIVINEVKKNDKLLAAFTEASKLVNAKQAEVDALDKIIKAAKTKSKVVSDVGSRDEALKAAEAALTVEEYRAKTAADLKRIQDEENAAAGVVDCSQRVRD
jgi:hypothetical protein